MKHVVDGVDVVDGVVGRRAVEAAGVERLPFLLARASRRLDELVASLMDDRHPVRGGLEDIHALERLSGSSGASVSAVAEHLGVRAQSASERLGRLARAGLVDHGPHPTDPRAVLVVLTMSGWDVLLDYRRALDEALGHLADELGLAGAERDAMIGREDAARPAADPFALLAWQCGVLAHEWDLRTWWQHTRAVAGPSAWARTG